MFCCCCIVMSQCSPVFLCCGLLSLDHYGFSFSICSIKTRKGFRLIISHSNALIPPKLAHGGKDCMRLGNTVVFHSFTVYCQTSYTLNSSDKGFLVFSFFCFSYPDTSFWRVQYNLAAQPQYSCLSAYKVIINSVSHRWLSKKYNDLSDVNGYVKWTWLLCTM